MTWRPMQLQDLDAVVDIASAVHPLFPEDRDVFANKLALHPAWALVLESAGHPAGYCFALPWHGVQPPALNTMLDAISPAADALYMHDLALLPAARGTGAGAAAVDMLLAEARRLSLARCFLVAVNGSVPYWSRLGFAVCAAPELQARLASYGDDARLMVRPV
jgi:ribosomal protein S18 acetylase RimI-like enzyme